jgi:ParB family chromosome partitioning protein
MACRCKLTLYFISDTVLNTALRNFGGHKIKLLKAKECKMATQKKAKRPHLGRGLESLLGPMGSPDQNATKFANEFASTASSISPGKPQTPVRRLNLNSIQINPYQPRTKWDDGQLQDLAASIRSSGVIQPIIVRATSGGYELIAGERRLRASKLAGKPDIPAIVRDATDEQMLELALVENIHRADLNPIERAKAYQRFIESFSLTHAEAAEKLGQARTAISNHLRLLDLPRDIQNMLLSGQLTMGHAKAILALPTDELRRKLANSAMAGRLSVRQVEKLVKRYSSQTSDKGKSESTVPPYLVDMERQFGEALGTKVRIDTRKNGQSGRVIIDFYSLDEFDSLSKKLGVNSAISPDSPKM